MLSDVTEDAMRGTAVAVFRFFGDLGFVLGPLVAGASADAFGYGAAFSLSAIGGWRSISAGSRGNPSSWARWIL